MPSCAGPSDYEQLARASIWALQDTSLLTEPCAIPKHMPHEHSWRISVWIGFDGCTQQRAHAASMHGEPAAHRSQAWLPCAGQQRLIAAKTANATAKAQCVCHAMPEPPPAAPTASIDCCSTMRMSARRKPGAASASHARSVPSAADLVGVSMDSAAWIVRSTWSTDTGSGTSMAASCLVQAIRGRAARDVLAAAQNAESKGWWNADELHTVHDHCALQRAGLDQSEEVWALVFSFESSCTLVQWLSHCHAFTHIAGLVF